MKKIYLLSIIMVLTMMFGSATVFAQDLIAHYKFEEGSGTVATDASGNSNDGTIVGTPNWVDGEINGALQFLGTESVAFPAGFMGMTSDQGSVAFWLIAGTNTDINTVFWAGDTELGNGFGADNEMHIHFESPVADIWAGGEIGFWALGDPNVHIFSDPEKFALGTGAGVPPVNPTLVNDSVWHHIAGTWGDGSLKLYIDGVLSTEIAYTSTSYPLNFMLVGKMAGRDNRTLIGSLDDVRVYDGVLNGFDIEDLFNKVGDPGVGVDQISANSINLSIYPNPASTGATVKFSSEAGKNVSINMYSVTGALIGNVYEGISTAGNNTANLKTAAYASGVYFVELKAGSNIAHSKLIIQN
ncbi:MAG: T9SS type A sorting domain-containing protein [Prolixibacteraceae bacterium]|jgi:hypothetical protein|nr:T9SS type A sorting domain-containing protein [Prolixibacteraceae bacterium]